jgi:hypothetical protein
MASGFKTPITIVDAMQGIHQHKYLLPAIQRNFIWSYEQIELMFDSIMRGYPINSFMFWKISDESLKAGYKFYEFLKEYRESYKTSSTELSTAGMPDFEAVIDGQQRLNSLYIGLCGSYGYKRPRKWWSNSEDAIPTRLLHLNLKSPAVQKYDNQQEYDFRFLTMEEYDKRSKSPDEHWFKVGDIMSLFDKDEERIDNYLEEHSLIGDRFVKKTLQKLSTIIHKEPIRH